MEMIMGIICVIAGAMLAFGMLCAVMSLFGCGGDFVGESGRYGGSDCIDREQWNG